MNYGSSPLQTAESKMVNYGSSRIFQAHSISKDINLVEVRLGKNLARRGQIDNDTAKH